ncbi:MAG: hypothetical protein ABS84_14870 [Rubrivivax sp. SCN 71-131]|nr:MAG: hypothetical protein ABS84_14870 [Rubrivivax sp. SCN 71-131]
MTTQQQTALESLAGRALTEGEVTSIGALVDAWDTQGIADALSVGRTRVEPRLISERGVRALPVLPRSRHALLSELASAATAAPAWLVPTLTAVGVPADDHDAYAADLASAHGWLLNADGLDVGAPAARAMLDMIAIAVPATAAACTAVKALAEHPDPITHMQVALALQGAA